jgi:hypothetical protein
MNLSPPELPELSSTGFALLVLPFHTGLFVVPALLELLEETLIRKLPLRDLECLLDIVMIDPDFQRFPFTK